MYNKGSLVFFCFFLFFLAIKIFQKIQNKLKYFTSLPTDAKYFALVEDSCLPGKPGEVRDFVIGRRKVRKIMGCLWCAVAVVIVTK